VAELPTSDGRSSIYIIFNVSDFLHICPYAETHRVRLGHSLIHRLILSPTDCYSSAKVESQLPDDPAAASMHTLHSTLLAFWMPSQMSPHHTSRHRCIAAMSSCGLASHEPQPVQEPVRSIYFGTRTTTGTTSPTCHDFTAASDGLDLLVGLSNGEGLCLTNVRRTCGSPHRWAD